MFFQDLPEEWQSRIFEIIRQELIDERVIEGEPEAEQKEIVDGHINRFNTPSSVREWVMKLMDED